MIHLDHAATSVPRRPEAVSAAAEASSWVTPGRGGHAAQRRAREGVEAARSAVRALCPTGVVCFTSGATAALSQAVAGWRPAPRAIAIGPMVHNAVRRPVLATGAPTWTLPHDVDGLVDLAEVERGWRSETDLVVVTHGSNVTGLLQPVAELVRIAHARGAAVVVDAAQTAGVIAPLDVGEADAVAFSAHKGLAGLPGAGALVLAENARVEPLVRGGTGFDSPAPDVPEELPARLESGTPNLPGIAAMGAAARASVERRWDWRAAGEALREAVAGAGLRPVGRGELPVASFRIEGLEPGTVEEILDRVYGIAVRAGLHCAPAAHRTLGTAGTGTVRVSAGACTTAHELEALRDALREIRRSIAGETRRVPVG